MHAQRTERGFAMIMGIVIVLILVVLSTGLVYSSAAHHLQSVQSADRARALAVAEGAASMLLADLSDDPLAPVRATSSYAVEGSTYTRTYEPFDPGDGKVKVDVTYVQDSGGVLTPMLFKDRADPRAEYARLHVVITGYRPRGERAIEIDLEQRFILLGGGAIVNDSVPSSATQSGKSLGHEGHIVFADKGRKNQIFVSGNLFSNGGIYYEDISGTMSTGAANQYINFAGRVGANLAGTQYEIADYTAIGSQDQLFDFDRFIAAARAGAGREFTSLEAFAAAMNTANIAGRVLEGITVLSIDPADYGNKNPKIGQTKDIRIPGGINLRGTLLFNFAPGTPALFKVFIKTPLNINAADLTGMNPSDPTTYPSGYDRPWDNEGLRPSATVIGNGFTDFSSRDDYPALMFNTGVVDIHDAANISGLVYGPSFIEIENKEGKLQYFNGSILGGAGVYIEGNSTAGQTVISFDESTIELLATLDAKGEGLKLISWRTVR